MNKKATADKKPRADKSPPAEEGATVQIDVAELDRLRRIEEHHGAIEKKELEVRRLEQDYGKKKDAALAAKKLFDTADAELRDMIAARESPQMQLPFDGPKPGEPVREAAPVTAGWEAVPISALALGKGVSMKLVEHGIKTIGQLEQRRRDHGRALDLKGIGEAHADTISNAADEWLRNNRDKETFDAAKAGGSKPALGLVADVRFFKLKEDVKAGETTHQAGAIFEVAEDMEEGRLALFAEPSGQAIFAVDVAEGDFVQAAVSFTKVRIIREVPGHDPESSGLKVGAEFEVVTRNGENVCVRSGEAEVMLTPAEFEAVDTTLVEVPY